MQGSEFSSMLSSGQSKPSLYSEALCDLGLRHTHFIPHLPPAHCCSYTGRLPQAWNRSSSCSPLEFSDLQSSKTASLFLPSGFCSKVTSSGRPSLTTLWGTATLPQPRSTPSCSYWALFSVACLTIVHTVCLVGYFLSLPIRNVSSMRAGTSCYSATSPGAGVWQEFSKYSLNIH